MLKSLLHPKVRVALFIVSLNAVWILAAAKLLERSEWLWLTPFALSINFILLAYDHLLPFSNLEGLPIRGQDPWGALKVVHELSKRLKIRPPRIFLIRHPSAHVFSYAKTAGNTRLFITEGLLDLLSPNELSAVLTFQLVSMRHSFTFLNYWLAASVDILLRLGQGAERLFTFVFGWTPPIKAWLAGPWVWLLRILLISPRDYQYLDRRTAEILGHPEDLAKALWKMEAYAQTRPWRDPWVFSHMCMVSPLKSRPIGHLLSPQPSLKGRIKRLVGRYPL